MNYGQFLEQPNTESRVVVNAVGILSAGLSAQYIPAPVDVFGFEPGTNYKLIELKTDNANSQALGVEKEHAGFFLRQSKAFSVIKPAEFEGKMGKRPRVEIYS